MSDIQRLIKQSSHYSVAQILVMATGFVSFPILTRVFSVEEYGILNLVMATVSIVLAFSKFGLQNATVRFLEEFKSNKRNEPAATFYSTLFFGPLLICGVVSFLYGVVIKLIFLNLLGTRLANLLAFVAFFIFFRSVSIIVTTFLRAEQKTKLYNLITVVSSYGSLSLSLLFIFYLIKGLYGFFFGKILVQAIVFFIIGYLLYRKYQIRLKHFSKKFFKEAVYYSFPLMWTEFNFLMLTFANRYIIQYFMGPAPLGIYAAGYNLSFYLSNILFVPLDLAVFPLYMDIWVKKGEAATKEFLSRTLRIFLLLALPIGFGFVAISKELIVLLASSKFAMAYVVIPYIVSGTILFATSNIFKAGLLIYKKTSFLTLIMFVGVVMNVILNLLLVPKWGIIGAAFATFIAYLTLLVLTIFTAFKELSFPIDYRRFFIYIFSSVAMFIAIKSITLDSQILNLSGKIGVGIIVYSLLVFIFDKEVRTIVFSWLRRH